MRDYQRTTNNPYHLPHNLWRQTLYQIRDYNRLKEEAESIAELSAINDSGGGGSGISDMTANKVCQRERYLKIIKAVDDARESIPKEFQRGVWNNILYDTAFPDDADRSTYSRYKSRLVYKVAKNLEWI